MNQTRSPFLYKVPQYKHMENIYNESDRKRLAGELTSFLTKGYIKTKRIIPEEHLFKDIMTETVDCILALQTKCKPGTSFVTAGLLLLLEPDKEDPEEYADIIKAGIVYYMLEKVPNVAKELGFKVL